MSELSTLPAAAFGAALAALPGIGPQQLRALIDAREPAEAWQRVATAAPEVADRYPKVAARWSAAARAFDVEAWWMRCTVDGRRVAVLGHVGYPPALAEDHAAPAVLFIAGDAEAIEGRARVAVVGTRRCTAAGAEMAERLGRELADAGVAVVSGLALGIDGAAHRGALSSGGTGGAVGVVGQRPRRALSHPAPASVERRCH